MISISIEGYDGNAVYAVRDKIELRIFGIVLLSGETETMVSVETGEIVAVDKPWWAFLATG